MKPVMSALSLVSIAAILVGCTQAPDDVAKGQSGAQADPATAEEIAFDFDEEAAAKLPEEIADAGTLTIATDPTFPPFEFTADDNTTIIGFDIDLAHAVGDVLGVDVGFKTAKFDSIIPGLKAGKYDMSVSAFAITDERKKQLDLVPYAASGDNVAVQAGNPHGLSTDWETLCGAKLAIAKGTTQALETAPSFSEKCVAAGEEPLDVDLYPDEQAATLALTSGRAQAKLTDAMTLAYAVEKTNGKMEISNGDTINKVPVGMAVSKDSELTPALVAALKIIAGDPKYDEVIEKWGAPTDLGLKPSEISVED